MSYGVLVIDDEKSFRVIAEAALLREGYAVRTADSGEAGARAWRADPPDVVLLDRNLPDVDGVDLLATLTEEARERGADTLFLVVTAYADVENAVQALQRGADDYLTKPVQLSDMLLKVRKALEARRLRNRVRALRHESRSPPDALLESESPAMREVIARAQRVAQSPSTSVLLQGESGTGKEIVARLIHDETPGRRDEAMVTLNCAAIAEGLLESELFGHERGAFTDAKTAKRGLLELAAGGTLSFRRVGGTRDLAVDVRIVGATNRNLEDEVAAGRFRLDLFHRLDVFHLSLPPLRERREDIPRLARFLLERIAHRLGRAAPELSREAEHVLVAYDYPGNVRELRNVLERALILEAGPRIGTASLVLGRAARPAAAAAEPFFAVGLGDGGRPLTLSELEKLYVERLLAHAGGNRTQAARLLDVSYPTIAKKIADYGIKLPD